MRELQLWDADEGLDQAFADVAELALGCRFSDCAHDREPGCAVRAAIASGTLASDRLESQRKLQRELDRLERRTDPAAIAARRRQVRVFSNSVKATMARKYGGPDG
jgi:ribosome biogenesis GTPase